MPTKAQDSLQELELEGDIVGQYLLRKRPATTPHTGTVRLRGSSPEEAVDTGDPAPDAQVATVPTVELVSPSSARLIGEDSTCASCQDALQEAEGADGVASPPIDETVLSLQDKQLPGDAPASCASQEQARLDNISHHQQALLEAQAALQQAEEARSAMHAQMEELQAQAAQGADLAERMHALQEELEDRDATVAEYEAQVARMAQVLRDGQLQAESAKAALMGALREGQDKAAASQRATAREMNRVADESNLLEIVYRFAGMYVDLQDLYVKEASERRRLHNALVDTKGAIRVFARLRPLWPARLIGPKHWSATQWELSLMPPAKFHGCSALLKRMRTHDLRPDASVSTPSPQHQLASHLRRLTGRAGGAKHSRFTFDAVFGPSASQDDVYTEAAPVVTSVLDGYHVCMFAYGQTGSGKTHTMQGLPHDRGVNFRALEDLFRLVAIRAPETDYEICVSLVEVYLEKIRDLLSPNSHSSHLEVKHNAHGSYLAGLTEEKVVSASEAQRWLCVGLAARASAETAMNTQSSRSHCLLCVRVTGRSKLTGDVCRAKLWLVDLAGSERLDKSTIDQGPEAHKRLQEAQFINKSLASLGDCIHALSSRAAHVPFRNSKLTYMLQDSLAGGSKTLMFVNVGPSEADVGESVCSLNFAARVRGVELGAVRRNIDAAADVRSLQAQVAAQQLQMTRMQADHEGMQRELKAVKSAAASPSFARLSSHGSPSMAPQQPSPSRAWGAGAGQPAVQPARMRPPAARPSAAAKAVMRATPRSAVCKVMATPRSAMHKWMGQTVRRATGFASGVVRQSIMSPATKATSRAVLGTRPPATAFKSSAKPGMRPAALTPAAAPAETHMQFKADPPHSDTAPTSSGRIAALHGNTTAALHNPPSSNTVSRQTEGPTTQQAGKSTRPPVVPRLKLPARPSDNSPRDTAETIPAQHVAPVAAHSGQQVPGPGSSVAPDDPPADQGAAHLAKFISYYHGNRNPSVPSVGSSNAASRLSSAGAARVRAPIRKPPAIFSQPERTPMPVRHRPA